MYVTIGRPTTLNTASTPTQPNFNRSYYYPQGYFFAQDSFRVSSRLTLNYGVRYDNFGGPENTGATKDALLQLGTGGDFNARLSSATLVQPTSGNEPIFGADNGDWAGRFGFSWDPFGKSKTVLRGGYGIFYDAPFDNLWQNVRSNDLALVQYVIPTTQSTNYLAPIPSVLPTYASQTPGALTASNFPDITLMDPKLRNGYAQDAFLGVQQSISENLTFEVNGTASLGRRLLTTDIVNREFTTPDLSTLGRPNGTLGNVDWRSSQGNSDYTALSAIVKYHWRTLLAQAAYTWSHAIDDQSDPLNGDFFNLDFTAITNGSSTGQILLFRAAVQQQWGSGELGLRPEAESVPAGNLAVGRQKAADTGMADILDGGVPEVDFPTPSSLRCRIPASAPVSLKTSAAMWLTPRRRYCPIRRPAPAEVYLLGNPAAFAVPQAPGVVGNTGRNEVHWAGTL